jgi:hypothetical protein
MRTWTWTRTWKHGRGHGNMVNDTETLTRTWQHGRGHGNIDEDMETWSRTWRHGTFCEKKRNLKLKDINQMALDVETDHAWIQNITNFKLFSENANLSSLR